MGCATCGGAVTSPPPPVEGPAVVLPTGSTIHMKDNAAAIAYAERRGLPDDAVVLGPE